ncbi:MAG TPA: methyltransferase domain-containing protein [Ktedonobacterales bacterium]|jgi:ubiquinone/menaquinone biosynthesis C-methylase UbiE
MHSSARHRRRNGTAGEAGTKDTSGLVLNDGWRYDLLGWFHDTFSSRGMLRTLRQRTIQFAELQPGEQALDIGCGTGTLALEAARYLSPGGSITGVDPGGQQIARARAKAARRHVPWVSIEFQIGVIEQLPFPDQTFDVVFSTLMMHHLPTPLKRQGLAEIARVLKPGGRVVIADFTHKQERAGRATRFPAGGSRLHDLDALLQEAGFIQLVAEDVQSPRFSSFPGANIVRAYR